MFDSFGRVIDYARLSVTDRCNLRCVYCLPESEKATCVTMPFDDLMRIGKVLASLGVKKFKITGGEPTLRPDIVEVVRSLKSLPNITDVTLTTNGLTLADLAPDLAAAGLDSVNISIDSLNPAIYRSLTGVSALSRVLKGLEAASAINSVKVNCVPQSATTEDDLLALVNLARKNSVHVRLIELMPIGGGSALVGLSPETAKEWIERAYGPLTPSSLRKGNGPAVYYSLEGFKGLIGFISALQGCFCERCNRLRITADGHIKTCLHLDPGRPLPLHDERAMAETILAAVHEKPARHLFQTPGMSSEAGGRSMRRIGG